MSTLPPFVPAPQPVVAKKVSPLVWILLALGGFCLLIFFVVLAAGFFFLQKAHQAGLDPALMRKNPGLATVKLMAALNPAIEILSYDGEKGQVGVRDKKSGKTYFVSFEDAKKGRFVFQESGKTPVTLTTSGSDAKVPTWIPDYPNSTPIGAFLAQSEDGISGSYHFKTRDPLDKIAKYYEDGLKSQGLRTTSTLINPGAIISGEQGNKSAVVLVGTENGESTVSVTFKSKK